MANAIAWFTRDTYAAHRRLDPTGLQPTFDECEQSAQALVQQHQAAGTKVTPVEIDPHELAVWCRANGTTINSKARALFALVVINRIDGEGQAGSRNRDRGDHH